MIFVHLSAGKSGTEKDNRSFLKFKVKLFIGQNATGIFLRKETHEQYEFMCKKIADCLSAELPYFCPCSHDITLPVNDSQRNQKTS
jgi:hypothetical protein